MNPRILMALFLAAVLSLGAVVLVATARHDSASAEEDVAAADGEPSTRTEFEGSVLPPGVQAPDFALENQDGELVHMRDLRGEPVIVTFLYTTCDETCPPQAQQIKGALDDLGHDVPVVAIAVDPDTDTQERARIFLAQQRMLGRMDFVLGSEAELRPLWDAYAIQPQLRNAEHQARIVLVDGSGRQRVAFPLDQATPERIAHDVRALEAGA